MNYPKIALLPEDYASAMALLRDRDHAEALQLAVEERVGCSGIVTLDQKFARTYQDWLKFTTHYLHRQKTIKELPEDH